MINLCLPVVRVAHAWIESADGTPQWVRLAAPDIFLVMREAAGTNLVMRVIHGNRVLDSIDLTMYSHKSRTLRQSLLEHNVHPALEQLPIYAITRDMTLAVRYMAPEKGGIQRRRIQVRFESVQACTQVVDVLRSLDIGFQPDRPMTGRSSASQPSSNTSLLQPPVNEPADDEAGRSFELAQNPISQPQTIDPPPSSQAVIPSTQQREVPTHSQYTAQYYMPPTSFTTTDTTPRYVPSTNRYTTSVATMTATGQDQSSSVLEDNFLLHSNNMPMATSHDDNDIPPKRTFPWKERSNQKSSTSDPIPSATSLPPLPPLPKPTMLTTVPTKTAAPTTRGTKKTKPTNPRTKDQNDHDDTSRRHDSTEDAPHDLLDAAGNVIGSSRIAIDRDATREGDKATTNSSATAVGRATGSPIDEYVVQTTRKRRRALEDFIVENLDDPGFVKLCEDVDECWRRVALGM